MGRNADRGHFDVIFYERSDDGFDERRSPRFVECRDKLPPKSPELLVALGALVAGWQQNPRAQARLARAAASGDRDIRHAAAAHDQP